MVRYPQLRVNLEKFRHNAREVISRCSAAGIEVAGVVKGYDALIPLVKILKEEGAVQIATSRLRHIRKCREAGIPGPYMLLRIPMKCELEDVAELAEISMQSDLSVMEELSSIALEKGIVHKVIVMADVGDLREGFWDKDEMVDACARVEESLKGLELMGIGTNVGCYGARKPTVENLGELIDIAGRIGMRIGRPLEVVSGGATSSFTLIHDGTMPEGINHLRIGEHISLALDLKTEWGYADMDYLHTDVFTYRAQVLEVYDKPTCPVGEATIDAFGGRPVFEDRGIRKRALIGCGKFDVGEPSRLRPRAEGIEILGASSDHMILDVEDYEGDLKAGDVLDFDINYVTQMFITANPDVEVIYE